MTGSPRYASASAFSFWRIIALISGGAYSLPSAFTRTSSFGPLTTSYGTIFISSETSSNLRPMKRLIEKIVFCGFVTCWRLRRRADEPLAVLRERDDGRRRAPALGVRDDGRLAALEHGHARVGRAEVDSEYLCHSAPPIWAMWMSRTKSKPYGIKPYGLYVVNMNAF